MCSCFWTTNTKTKKMKDYLKYFVVFLLTLSVILNLFFVTDHQFVRRRQESRDDEQLSSPKYDDIHEQQQQQQLSWSLGAAIEAENVASIYCSGHGRAYVDGVPNADGNPICECNSCYGGPDCSQFDPTCVVDADIGDLFFLEPFWMKHASNGASLVAGWHRMSYYFSDGSLISIELDRHIRELHAVVGNADTTGKFIVFGAGSTQLLGAALYALNPSDSLLHTRVVTSVPFYPLYKTQTELFNSENFKWHGEASLWKNSSNAEATMNFTEFVTSPSNPIGGIEKAVLNGSSVNHVFDHAFYWPQYSPIPTLANEDFMTFSLSKATGHSGSRFGWALVKDEEVHARLLTFIKSNSYGVSKDTQLRALTILKLVLQDGSGKEFFEFGRKTLRNRWERLTKALSTSKRFSLQKRVPQYCNYLQTVTAPSPAYAWVKCEREEESDCGAVLRGGGIIGRNGSMFNAEDRYIRVNLVKSNDDFNLILQRMEALASQEVEEESTGAKIL